MDALLSRLGVQAMNYAIRSGLALTSTYAISQCSRLMKSVDDKGLSSELKILKRLLNNKIHIISPAIDLIEFKSGRGNVFLERAVPLAKSLHREIITLGKRLESAADREEDEKGSRATPSDKSPYSQERELRSIIADLKGLLARIDHDIPLLSLAISASGESLATSMPPGVSPSRLLQASMLLNIGDTQYSEVIRPVQIGPTFTLSLYMLFVGHSQDGQDKPTTPSTPQRGRWEEESEYGFGEGSRKPIWKEVIHKTRVRLCRTPIDFEFRPTLGYCRANQVDEGEKISASPEAESIFVPSEFAYHLELVEDLDDGRVHDDEEAPCHAFDSIEHAGIRQSIPIYQFSKIFYTDTGRILNVGSADDGDNSPVLLLKRDHTTQRPARMSEFLQRRNDSPSQHLALVDDENQSQSSDDQADLDRQIMDESLARESPEKHIAVDKTETKSWTLPADLDPDWIALEVFGDDELDSGDDSDDESSEMSPKPLRRQRQAGSLDSSVVEQIRNLSFGPSARTGLTESDSVKSLTVSSPTRGARNGANSQDSIVARSPFGAITTSLSLLEMLIRLTSLQEFQQVSHLAVPDHILTFFLEETSTTGLTGIEKWKAHKEAQQKVGFDPYIDTP